MSTIQTAKSLLAETEKALRELMRQELEAQRYSELGELASLADGLSRLSRGDSPLRTSSPELPMTSRDSFVAQKKPDKRPLKKLSKRATATKGTYPYFERDGDILVKVGWSKKKKAPYEHRAPYDAINAFARHLTSKVSEGKVFSIENLMPVPDLQNDGEIPSYQVYLILTWLRHGGAIVKRGRDGYVASCGALASDQLEKAWASIAKRHE